MTVDEAKESFEALKAQGATKEDILGTLYLMYGKDELDFNQFEALVNVLGYDITDEFKALSDEDKKTKGWITDASEEEVKEAKEFGDDEDEDEDEDESEIPDEEKEKAEAERLFGFSK